jgi:multidrug resistance efflux pump
VKKGDVMAVLEIPELEAQIKQDEAAIANAKDAVTRAQHVVEQVEAQRVPIHQNADRLASVAKSNPGLVAQQEIDNAQGQDLALASQVEAGEVGGASGHERSWTKPTRISSATRRCSLRQNHRAVRWRGDATIRQSGRSDAGRHQPPPQPRHWFVSPKTTCSGWSFPCRSPM